MRGGGVFVCWDNFLLRALGQNLKNTESEGSEQPAASSPTGRKALGVCWGWCCGSPSRVWSGVMKALGSGGCGHGR